MQHTNFTRFCQIMLVLAISAGKVSASSSAGKVSASSKKSFFTDEDYITTKPLINPSTRLPSARFLENYPLIIALNSLSYGIGHKYQTFYATRVGEMKEHSLSAGSGTIFPQFLDFIKQIAQAAGLNSYQLLGTNKVYQHPQYTLPLDLKEENFALVSGRTGMGDVEDIPVVMHYSERTNSIIIAAHGTLSTADWFTNVKNAYSTAMGTRLPPVFIEGRHGTIKAPLGFVEKVNTFYPELEGKLFGLLKSVPEDKRSSLIIYVTGHSQGAALAILTALKVIESLEANPGIIDKTSFSNQESNLVQVYRLSSPRIAFGEDSQTAIHTMLGHYNNLRHNHDADLIPHLPFKRSFRSFWDAQNNPDEFYSTGILALDGIGVNRKAAAAFGHVADSGLNQMADLTESMMNSTATIAHVAGTEDEATNAGASANTLDQIKSLMKVVSAITLGVSQTIIQPTAANRGFHFCDDSSLSARLITADLKLKDFADFDVLKLHHSTYIHEWDHVEARRENMASYETAYLTWWQILLTAGLQKTGALGYHEEQLNLEDWEE